MARSIFLSSDHEDLPVQWDVALQSSSAPPSLSLVVTTPGLCHQKFQPFSIALLLGKSSPQLQWYKIFLAMGSSDAVVSKWPFNLYPLTHSQDSTQSWLQRNEVFLLSSQGTELMPVGSLSVRKVQMLKEKASVFCHPWLQVWRNRAAQYGDPDDCTGIQSHLGQGSVKVIKSHHMTEQWGVVRLLLATGTDNTMPTNTDAQYVSVEHRVAAINWG